MQENRQEDKLIRLDYGLNEELKSSGKRPIKKATVSKVQNLHRLGGKWIAAAMW